MFVEKAVFIIHPSSFILSSDYTEGLPSPARGGFLPGDFLPAMRTLLIVGVIVALFGAAVFAGYKPAMEYWQKQNAPKWRTSDVAQGNIVSVVNSTGTI